MSYYGGNLIKCRLKRQNLSFNGGCPISLAKLTLAHLNSKFRKKNKLNATKENGKLPEPIGLEVRKKSDLLPMEIDQLKRAELFDYGNLEAWTALGTNKQLAYSTHGAMRFFGKFPPPIATYLIDQYAKSEESIVVDPMGGSGSTVVECLLKNRTCYSFDVNPMMLLLQRVKTTRINTSVIDEEFQLIKKNYKPTSFEKNLDKFVGLKDPYHWFLPETADSLLGIKTQIDKIKNDSLREFFQVCFLSIVRRVSRATTQQGRLFLDVETAEKETFPFFEKKVNEFKLALLSLPTNNKKITIALQNLMDEEGAKKYTGIADLVILHPPYFNSYKYSNVTSLETFWMGIDHANIRPSEVREFFKVGKPEKNEIFVEDMSLALINALGMLKKGGHLGFMMGDTVIKGEYIPVMKKTLEKAGVKKSNLVSVAVRVPKYTEASWAASQRRNTESVGVTLSDFLVVIKK